MLSDWVEGLPEMEKRQSSGMPGPRARQTEEQKAEWKRLISEYPWLAQKVAAVEKSKAARVSGGSKDVVEEGESDGCASDDLDDAVADILDDEEVEGIFDTLAKIRADWKEQFASAGLKDFETGILGGASTFKSTSSKSKAGLVADYVCCEASTAAAKSFCTSYGLQRSKTSIDRALRGRPSHGPHGVVWPPDAVLSRSLQEVWRCRIPVYSGRRRFLSGASCTHNFGRE